MSDRARDSGHPRIVVVDDHPIVKQAMAAMFEMEGWELCGEGANASTAKDVIQKQNPDLAVVDLSLADSHGLDLIRDLHVQYPALPILVFSQHDESQYAERAIRAGAAGYVMKSEPPKILIDAIRSVLEGEIFLSPRMSKLLLRQTLDRKSPQAARSSESRLTDREVTILEFLGKGMTAGRIAQSLNLSVKTIDAHRANLKRKLGLRSGAELVVYACKWVEKSVGPAAVAAEVMP
jgi:DNA-binding NarL/FixJ family response regulator